MPGSWECILDMIPNDMVCSGMICSLAALLNNTHKVVYQYGSSDTNPLSTGRAQEIGSLYKRRALRKSPKGNPLLNSLKQMYGTSPITPEYFRKYSEPKYAEIAGSLSVVAEKSKQNVFRKIEINQMRV